MSQTNPEYVEPPIPPQHLTQPGMEHQMDPPPVYQGTEYQAAQKLKGKVALITGGDSGIGRSVAVLFAREGADVAICYLEEEEQDAQTTRKAVEAAGQRALLIPGDLTDVEFCRALIQQTTDHYGRIDILVNNAAFQKHREGIEEVSIEQWDRTFHTNIRAYFLLSKFALPHMPAGSSIINTGSVTGIDGSEGLLDYSATKGAIHAFTKSLAQSLISKDIRVNCVAPGPVWTPLNPAERTDEEMRDFGSGPPLGRPAQPEEIAPSYVFLASNADSRYISGLVIPILGGGTVSA